MVDLSRYRHIKRYRQIIFVFVKHGFGTIIDQLGIFDYINIRKKIEEKDESIDEKLSTGGRLRLSLEELGTTFIKLGQILSTRPDILPHDVIVELEKLQDAVPPFPFDDVKSLIESEFDDKLGNIYREFNEIPLAAASIAQVHLARLNSGRKVVVKIQRPGIERNIDLDLMVLKDLASFIDHHTKYGKLYNFTKTVQEFESTLKNELDFRIEGENAETFKENFSKDKGISVPDISWIHTTRRVLTMEYIDGIPLNDFEALDVAGLDRKLIARNLGITIFNQILRDGFFHGDPHPGNIMVLPDNEITFLDFGMIGKLNDERKLQFLKMLMGITFKNSRLILEAIIAIDAMTHHVNMKKLEREIDALRDKYLSIPLNEIKVGEVFKEVFNLAFSYNIVIPSEFTMLAKTLVTLEGLVAKLDPELNVLEIADPIARNLMFKSFSPEKIGVEFIGGALDYGSLLRGFPSIFHNYLRKLEDDEFTMQFQMKGIESVEKRFEKIFNRITFSVVLLAVSIIIAGIVIGIGGSGYADIEVYTLSITALKVGLIVASFIIVGLILSILRSTRLK
ncbi:2-octaprenylphenol hydroxylase [Youngiibacter fragilis 232.1]|uniref:2-octaprenylphenol hydroxylase n=1 Tax=Youngiibacter fragilis 232.1 TaxID=994573 RepID=V7I5R2_9CLOT|nr:2-octaprenylphenol hydroxylase [Youngiibacter fragilis 232.1]